MIKLGLEIVGRYTFSFAVNSFLVASSFKTNMKMHSPN